MISFVFWILRNKCAAKEIIHRVLSNSECVVLTLWAKAWNDEIWNVVNQTCRMVNLFYISTNWNIFTWNSRFGSFPMGLLMFLACVRLYFARVARRSTRTKRRKQKKHLMRMSGFRRYLFVLWSHFQFFSEFICLYGIAAQNVSPNEMSIQQENMSILLCDT